MTNENMKYGLIGLLLGGITVWYLTYSSFNSNNFAMMSMMGLNANKPEIRQTGQVIDAHFIEQMIPHHEDAITMAKLALIKSNKYEIKNLSENIISSQSREIEQMNNWYRQWFGKETPKNSRVMGDHGMGKGTKMHMGMMGDNTDLDRLENAQDFDRAFIEEMIPHHQMAVMMASMLKNGTNRQEMKKLADDITSAQSDEIKQMRQWLKDWVYAN